MWGLQKIIDPNLQPKPNTERLQKECTGPLKALSLILAFVKKETSARAHTLSVSRPQSGSEPTGTAQCQALPGCDACGGSEVRKVPQHGIPAIFQDERLTYSLSEDSYFTRPRQEPPPTHSKAGNMSIPSAKRSVRHGWLYALHGHQASSEGLGMTCRVVLDTQPASPGLGAQRCC